IEKVSHERGTRQGGEAVKELPPKSKRWALIIGIDQYNDRQISSLNYASNDAVALADAFSRYAGFPKEQVILLASNQPEERQPTKGNILVRLANVARLVPKDGLLLLAFAGHGIERHGEAFLLPSDAKVSDNVRVLQATALSVTELKEWVQEMGVKQVLILLDACRNDPTAGRGDSANPLTESFLNGFDFQGRNAEVEALATLYATKVGQRAYEYSEKKHGYFTWAVVQGLAGRAANESGEVTLAGLEKFIQEIVPRQIALDLGAGKDQRPFADVRGYKAGELVLAKISPEDAKAAAEGPAPPDPKLVQLATWEKIRNTRDIRAFEDYRQKFPEGMFVQEASRRIEVLEWDAVKDAKSPEPVRVFLAKFPQGLFAEPARGAIRELEQREAGRASIEDILRRYEEAYNGKDLEKLRRVWPGLRKKEVGRIENFFELARSVSLKLDMEAAPEVNGESASVICRRMLQFTDEHGAQPAVEDRIRVEFRKSGEAWVIESVR
ncbi:MAG: caspase family protein, partial [Bryobacteraceae bacterium]